jgi:23S rRNA pseudouridine1911/1915/1917 synthase
MRIAVDEALAGSRLDQVVVNAIRGLGRAGAKRLFAEDRVFVVDARGRRRLARKGDRAVLGTEVQVDGVVADVAAVPDPDLALTVVYEDDSFVVVDKSAGIPSAPLRPGERGTVANALVSRFPAMQSVGHSAREPGLCHRLAAGTAGLSVAAKTPEAFRAFTRALRDGKVDKAYLAVVRDDDLAPEGRCEAPLAADPSDPRRVVVEVAGGRAAVTRYRVVERAGERALVEAWASRAFRHQVRVHLAALGAPLVGDLLYGGEEVVGLAHHALHASLVEWAGGEGVAGFAVRSALPDDLRALLS